MEKHYKVGPEKWFLRGFFMWMIIEMVSSQTPAPVPSSSREHKVHNIMLYPEKHSWCKPTPIKQVVTHPGCRSIDMENHICVGACFSFSVPRTIPETPGDDQLYYCDSCQPHTVSWTTVLLDCPDTPTREPVSKMVEMITNCSCNTFRNIEMYENQLASSSFPTEDGGEDDEEPGDDEEKKEEDEDEQDNSLPEINDFITRREKLNLKPILTSLTMDAVKDGTHNDINELANTNNQSTAIATETRLNQAVDDGSLSNGNTSSAVTSTLKPKFSHSDQLLQFQDLSGELVSAAEMEEEEEEEEEAIEEH